MTSSAWEDRILGYEPDVDPTQLLAHELNARRHPGAQRDALRESLGRVGWVDVVKVNQRTGKVVDGHARVEEAITAVGQRKGVAITTALLHGNVAAAIIEFSKENGVDLIVVGTKGHGVLEELLMGSVTRNLVSLAHIPVLVVKDSED